MALDEAKIEALQRMVDGHDRIVFFGGAGVSTESGVPDYRGKDGLDRQGPDENGYMPEEKREHSFMVRHPELFFDDFRKELATQRAKPNAAHRKLAELEQAGKLLAVITQNIDNLHQDAGSRHVIELHGNRERMYCESCGKVYPADYIFEHTPIPYCEHCGGIVRPDVVMFGESLDEGAIGGAVRALRTADMLIIAGTSLVVYPAAGLVDEFGGNCLVVINQQETRKDSTADLVIRDPVAAVLDRIEIRKRGMDQEGA